MSPESNNEKFVCDGSNECLKQSTLQILANRSSIIEKISCHVLLINTKFSSDYDKIHLYVNTVNFELAKRRKFIRSLVCCLASSHTVSNSEITEIIRRTDRFQASNNFAAFVGGRARGAYEMSKGEGTSLLWRDR